MNWALDIACVDCGFFAVFFFFCGLQSTSYSRSKAEVRSKHKIMGERVRGAPSSTFFSVVG